MRCRHCNVEWTTDWEYCPECKRNYGGAVYPAKQTREESADAEAIVAMIHQAFAGIQLEGGTTIHEADLEGAYLHEKVRLAARAKDPETDWTEVPAWKIERSYSALSFLDAKGWRFYIPAYMCWTLKNWRSSDSPTVDSLIWSFEPFAGLTEERFNTLTGEQSKAVYAFLDFFHRYSGEHGPIDAYWRRFGNEY